MSTAASKIYYFDYNATTPVAPEVLDAMMPFLTLKWGNPSSIYRFGRELAKTIEAARANLAALIHSEPKEIIFTSCGTESNNAVIESALVSQPGKRHVLMTAVEHSANIKFGESLANRGYAVTFLPVETDGSMDLRLLEAAIRPDTAIVSVMWANNETGVLFPIEDIASLCREKGVLFHTDAVQVAGKLELDVRAAGIDFLSLSAHKLYAPKGIGALFVRRGAPFQPFLHGGQQERGRRGGTENVAGIAGFGRAAELAMDRIQIEDGQVRALRDRLEDEILRMIPNTWRNGSKEPRLPNTTNIAFDSVEAEAVLIALDQLGICASSGSACATGSLEPSHVLRAMGLSAARARGSVRFSLGIHSTSDEVDFLLDQLPPVVRRLRALSAPLQSRHVEIEARNPS